AVATLDPEGLDTALTSRCAALLAHDAVGVAVAVPVVLGVDAAHVGPVPLGLGVLAGPEPRIGVAVGSRVGGGRLLRRSRRRCRRLLRVALGATERGGHALDDRLVGAIG